MSEHDDTVREEQSEKSERPSHTEGVPRGEDVGDEFQEEHPGRERSDAAGGHRVDTESGVGQED